MISTSVSSSVKWGWGGIIMLPNSCLRSTILIEPSTCLDAGNRSLKINALKDVYIFKEKEKHSVC